MKIVRPTTHMVEIGDLDHTLRLPMAARIRNGMKTVCCICGDSITDEYFIGGFKQGYPNMMLHERCLHEQNAAVCTESIDDCDQSITEPGLMAEESSEHDYHTCECSACREELHAWCNNVDESGYDAE